MIIIETEKLYSPVYCELMDTDNDEYGNDYESSPIPQTAAAYYADAIHEAILKERMPDEEPRGLMTYYHEADPVNGKVHSLHVDVEVHDDKLWGVATIMLTEPLTPAELDTLREYITGQYSDGFGEGFEQREIKVSDGELSVHLWDYDREGGFFIDTEREFRQRLGLEPIEAETPAQAALHEPDIYDDKATTALREELIDRLNTNLGDYFNSLHGMDGKEIASFSSEIAVTTDAHYYLTEMHNFHTSELEYLLKFQNPLEVVADAFDAAGIHDRSDIMWNIFDRQDALQGDYPLMPDLAGDDALKEELFGRLDKNLSDYHGSMMALDKPDLIGKAGEIAAVNDAHFYLTEHHEFDASEAAYLLQFQNPLEVVADAWKRRTENISDMSFTLDEVFGKQETLQGNYPLATDGPSSPASKENICGASAEKPSVLDRIREAAQAPKEPPKDKPARDKSGPEL